MNRALSLTVKTTSIFARSRGFAKKAAEAAPAAQAAPAAKTEGGLRKLTGLNIYKDGEDPVLKPDSEYPQWLWDLEPQLAAWNGKVTLGLKEPALEEATKLSKEEFLRLFKALRKRQIKARNEIKAKK